MESSSRAADDIIVIAKSPEAFQKLLDCINTCCVKWNMAVNSDKSKCITLSTKNRINKKDITPNNFFLVQLSEWLKGGLLLYLQISVGQLPL